LLFLLYPKAQRWTKVSCFHRSYQMKTEELVHMSTECFATSWNSCRGLPRPKRRTQYIPSISDIYLYTPDVYEELSLLKAIF